MNLPAPVAHYFEFVFRENARMIQRAVFKQEGTMRAGAESGWSPFSATQKVRASPPQYEWRAVMRVAGIIPLRIVDSYHDGVGTSRAALAGIFSMGGTEDTSEINSASLLRFLAEGAWTPSLLLPQSGVTWSEIDAASARASFTDGGTTVTMVAQFATDGRMLGIHAERYRAVTGGAVLTPWRGEWNEYRQVDGVLIPTSAEVAWQLNGVWVPVWRGRIAAAHYTY